MLAEVHGKISSLGSNLSERLEDNLTGNVFGALRYISFHKGLGEVIKSAFTPQIQLPVLPKLDYWADCVRFWPYDKDGELDVVIEFEDLLIGIEVKLFSGLSSDDDITNEEQQFNISKNQLARESRILTKLTPTKQKLLLLIAPRNACVSIYDDVVKRNLIDPTVKFGYISWQDFLHALNNIKNDLADFDALIIQDLMLLLQRKGFEDFNHFMIEQPQVNATNYFSFKAIHSSFTFHEQTSIKKEKFYEFK